MSRRIALLAAMPTELKPLVRGWKAERRPGHVRLWSRTDADGDALVAVCAGMGAEAVRRAFVAAEAGGRLDLVINLGLAGATEPALRVGEVACVSEVVDVQTGERFQLADGRRKMRLASVVQAAAAEEKQRLRASYGAALVDMEAATVARLAAMRNLPMCCFKAVSDEADAALPELGPFVDRDGQLRTAAFVAHAAVRPKLWKPIAALARGSRVASLALGRSVEAFLAHKDQEFTNRTGEFARKPQES